MQYSNMLYMALMMYFNVQEKERQSNIPLCDAVMDWLKINPIFFVGNFPVFMCKYIALRLFNIKHLPTHI